MNERDKKTIERIKNDMKLLYGQHSIVRNEDLKILLKLLEKQEKEIEKYRIVIVNLNNNWISKDELKNILEKLKDKEQEMSDGQGYWGGSGLQGKIEMIEELLGE